MSSLPDNPTSYRQQLTYRANQAAPSQPYTNQSLAPPTNSSMPHSFSSPMLAQQGEDFSDYADLSNQFNYLETIDVLHRRHLEEKQQVAGLRQKI